MKTITKNTSALYKEKDLRLLMNDTWSLIESLNPSQLEDLIQALDNVKLVIQYAVNTGMKGPVENTGSGKLRNLSTDTVCSHFQNEKALHFSGKY